MHKTRRSVKQRETQILEISRSFKADFRVACSTDPERHRQLHLLQYLHPKVDRHLLWDCLNVGLSTDTETAPAALSPPGLDAIR